MEKVTAGPTRLPRRLVVSLAPSPHIVKASELVFAYNKACGSLCVYFTQSKEVQMDFKIGQTAGELPEMES